MFLGENHHNLDAKGRMIVPAKFREELGQLFVITKGLDKCICIYPMETWKNIEDKLKAIAYTDKNNRLFHRFLIGSACECEPDSQGRFLIPQTLRTYANISKEVVSIGLTDRIEVWSKEDWEQYNEDVSIDGELEEKLSALGI